MKLLRLALSEWNPDKAGVFKNAATKAKVFPHSYGYISAYAYAKEFNGKKNVPVLMVITGVPSAIKSRYAEVKVTELMKHKERFYVQRPDVTLERGSEHLMEEYNMNLSFPVKETEEFTLPAIDDLTGLPTGANHYYMVHPLARDCVEIKDKGEFFVWGGEGTYVEKQLQEKIQGLPLSIEPSWTPAICDELKKMGRIVPLEAHNAAGYLVKYNVGEIAEVMSNLFCAGKLPMDVLHRFLEEEAEALAEAEEAA